MRANRDVILIVLGVTMGVLLLVVLIILIVVAVQLSSSEAAFDDTITNQSQCRYELVPAWVMLY